MDNKPKILIFDDDADILTICSFYLKRRGFETYTRTVCDDVIKVVEEVNPDLIIMDNWIPSIGGIQATKLIKKHKLFKATPVIYFSANANVEGLAASAGADAFIAKPFDLEDFEEVIRAQL